MTYRRAAFPPRLAASLVALLLPLAFSSARGEVRSVVTIRGESGGTKTRFEEACKRFEERKWGEAIEQLQAILNTAGDDLIADNNTPSIQARRLCQVKLAALPPEALRLYRQRYESQARKRMEQGKSQRDPLELRRVVEEMFCTRAAEKAIDLLGDLAFERGRFAEAEEWWRLLSPLPDARRETATRGFALVFPDLALDPARIQAKQLLARLFDHQDGAWATQLDAYRHRHGNAEGVLAGRKGRYADVLSQVRQERKAAPNAGDWPTFGGDVRRGRVIPAADDILYQLSALCREGPTWSFHLGENGGQNDPIFTPALNAKQARSLAFFPIIVGDRVVVADARRVTAYDLRGGKRPEPYDAGEEGNGGINPQLELPALPDLRYTLSAADGNVYARLGAQDIGMQTPAEPPRFGKPMKPRHEDETFLTCLSSRSPLDKETLCWQVSGKMPKRASLFEGAPLVANGQIWIASTRYANNRGITAIECYPADEPTGPPLRWRREICERSELKADEPRYRHHLLTLAGTRLVYCTHNGAVLAVDALTGRTLWAMRYPREEGETTLKDLAPVLFAAGRLFVAPEDSNRLICLDPETGRTLWMRENMKVVHLLGVGQGRLIFTTRGGLRAVGADDGEDASGWMIPHSGGELTPAGRGLLIGDLVLWPTVRHGDFSPQARVYAVRQRDGMPAGDPTLLHRLPAGNLAYGTGCLVVADLQTLSVFVPPRMQLSRRRAELRQRPATAAALLNLARAESDAGLKTAAIQSLRRAEAKAAAMRGSARKRLLHEARTERQRVLLELASQAAKAEQWEDAANAARQAAEIPLSPRGRLHALLRTARMWKESGQTERERTVWATIRTEDELKQIQILDREGRPMPAASAAGGRRSEVGGQRSEVRGQRSEVRGQRSEVKGQKAENESGGPLFRAWRVALDAEEWVLRGWEDSDSELLMTGTSRGQIVCRSSATGEVRWRRSLSFAPRWAGSEGGAIVAAGAKGIAGLRRENGEVLWHFSPPPRGKTARDPADDFSVIVDPLSAESLMAFHLVAGRLFFLQGQRRLFALDAATGAVLWDCWAPDGGFYFRTPRGCFSPCYHAGTQTVLIQMARQRWLLDAATGRLLHQAADGRELWKRPPLELDEHTLCIAPDYRHLVLLDSRTGKSLWTHTRRGGSTLSGETPQLLGRGEVLLVVEPANIGYFLQRLDRASGKPLWPSPVLLTAETVELNRWTFDRETVYGIEESALTARSLADGKIIWRQTWNGSGGQVRRVGDSLMVWSRPSAEDARLRFRSPLGAVQWNLGPLLTPEAVFSVACRDPKTGQLTQRLNFRMDAPARTIWRKRTRAEDGGEILISRTSSLLASEDGPVVRFDSSRPLIAAGGGVWGLISEIHEAERR